MYLNRAFIPIAAALIVAFVSAVVLFKMDFGAKNSVQRGPINMISAAAVERAGATTSPTQQRTQP